MKRIWHVLAFVPLVIPRVWAQDGPVADKMKIVLSDLQDKLKEMEVISIGGAVMGSAVKNAPYSAVEVTENTQMLGDGNRIHRENQVPVYRDSEGRLRRETSPDQIMIWDPVANTSYILNPRTQTARKMPLGMNYFYSGPQMTKFNTGRTIAFQTGSGITGAPAGDKVFTRSLDGGPMQVQVFGTERKLAPKSESLGKQMIEGVNAEGTRTTTMLDAGAIGNDRPIQISSESWYSTELQTLVKSVHSDPRTGEEVFRLINVSRAEPPSTLFQVPGEYQIVDQKLPTAGGRGAVVR
jgi:hypothetical protein